MARIIGYGICGPGEAKRYMRETMEEFKRLCDEVIILINNGDQAEIDIVKEYGFEFVVDRREWGAHQWRIKQDFIERDIKRIAREGDMLVCLDMDETIPRLTKEWLQDAKLDAYHVFIADLWNDPQHYKPESCFWNVRLWRWNGETKFKAKPVHCGLAPEWTYFYHRHAPFVLLHKGLMDPDDRARKVKRYEKYDPNAQHLDKVYYDMLKSDSAVAFDFEKISETIEKEVETYQQTKPRKSMAKKKQRFAYVKTPHGDVVDIPEKHVEKTMKRKGFEWVGWADEEEGDIEEMFEDTEVDEETRPLEDRVKEGSYQRSAADEKAEVENRNDEEEELSDNEVDEIFDEDEEADDESENKPDSTAKDEHPKPNPNTKPETKVEAPKKAPAKKSAKKPAKKSAKK